MKIKIGKRLTTSNLRQSDLRRIVRSEIKKNKGKSNLVQIATSGYTRKQKAKLKRTLKNKGYGEYRKQVKKFRQSNRANLVKALLRTKYGTKYAEREYRRTLKLTAHQQGAALTKQEQRARVKAYLNKLRAREYSARSMQAKEAIKQQREFMKEKFNAMINAGVSLNLTVGGKTGIPIEEYIDKYGYFEMEQLKEEYEERDEEIPSDADLYHELWTNLTSGAMGNVQALKQGAEYGYIDLDNNEVISPV